MISLVSLTLTSALQYTHDLQHLKDEKCTQHPADSTDHHEVCALCWFVAHQLTDEFCFSSYLPHAGEHAVYSLGETAVVVQSIRPLLWIRNGRAPPFATILLA
ncbi:MAG: hypothetical protein ACTJHT_00885 [Sphingobacterium sp.]|uniref:hypothetical protein n=1 Tax=Sphingobacterium sp. JB170 TaxID=1434842 RepID=UPI001179EDC0|nr:hypothetical protein [Sphingobacterium sp. JB170]